MIKRAASRAARRVVTLDDHRRAHSPPPMELAERQRQRAEHAEQRANQAEQRLAKYRQRFGEVE